MSEHNPFPDEGNTGHIWDDNLRELSNPPPNWWMMAWYASIAFVIGYGLIYPMIPLATTHTKGFTGWTAIGEYKADLAAVEAARKPYEDKIAAMSAKEILADEALSTYVEHSGKVLFGDNCSACHGAGGAGNVGFPVLADDDWLFGGTIEQIQTTITNGRKGMMTAHAATLSAAEIDTLANYVVGLSEGNADEKGKALFQSKACFACHGMDAKGMAALGSANLTDGIWRFDEADKVASAKRTIAHGVNAAGDAKTRNAEMPAFKDKLSEADIKKMAVYVYKFGGGK
ncbi:MAG: cytochrome-c oxidase, cbb3-type subunit III [gamma proteobacterium symbiont of Bathyaustriella thionipta]|nr:cytochrome-c oxidase, cbb3-type subunit III [gamma proteobacterium symbiont of Bathyaustriella thionipta]MCU7949143.1 cytochrome-c oxidase, cbb3-type subunit III [gamma proteobacterium symbiont of Bathyaustriella thionipta]MCU7952239.1 cytochrome-c oxidase, cbb3-type subunit III [gamma proteobacterium symbiont of Bathyaustriella thionipta]MCU7955788.1 cytochrome-c oxidase, cbb3-type subunit III [gamma proteobacterium symbiont of Bathyaustriella thionipta]MCU7965607.1 cytochrome-c oxidase, cb